MYLLTSSISEATCYTIPHSHLRMQEATVQEFNDPGDPKKMDEKPPQKSIVGRVLRFTTIDEDRNTLVLVPATRKLLVASSKSYGLASMHASASPLSCEHGKLSDTSVQHSKACVIRCQICCL